MNKICLVMYSPHTPEIEEKIIASAPIVDMFIANTQAGMYHTPVKPDKFQDAGIKVFSYNDGSYETRPLTEVLSYVDAVAVEGCYGFFLDQVSPFPTSTGLEYIMAVYSRCLKKGLKLMLNVGLPNWFDFLMTVCDLIVSEEEWDETISPSQLNWMDRTIVLSRNIPTVEQAIHLTKSAWQVGFQWHYACQDNIYSMPDYYTEYTNALMEGKCGS